ncbi:cation diffusion facilitator family transporter [Hoeflea sp.]|uniref:cation diffusion facilitator family transporter n=1 Tax=Hoeflea sp. TaxID=1940281 RepID=UPI002AFE2A2E|nr:cation diffusion facilitator family transporter [Hoeflea sp.]
MAGHHNHVDPNAGDARVFWAVVVNLGLTVAQIIGGILSGSLAMIADAIHNLSDALSLVIAFLARKIARRPADSTMTFGYGRAEVVAALINYTTLIVIGLYLIYEAVMRFIEPEGVDGWLVVIIAGIALIVDAATALLTYSLSKESVNIRAAFVHNVADALGSIAVIVAGTLIILYDWRWIDPLVTLLIAGYILWMSFSEIGDVIRILMLGSPVDLKTEKVLDAMQRMDGVTGVHHFHLWQMQEHDNAVQAHLVVAAGRWNDADAIKAEVKCVLKDEFSIAHSTLELECSAHACIDPEQIGDERQPLPGSDQGHDHDHGAGEEHEHQDKH